MENFINWQWNIDQSNGTIFEQIVLIEPLYHIDATQTDWSKASFWMKHLFIFEGYYRFGSTELIVFLFLVPLQHLVSHWNCVTFFSRLVLKCPTVQHKAAATPWSTNAWTCNHLKYLNTGKVVVKVKVAVLLYTCYSCHCVFIPVYVCMYLYIYT